MLKRSVLLSAFALGLAAPAQADIDGSIAAAKEGDYVLAAERLAASLRGTIEESTCNAIAATVLKMERGIASFEGLIGDVYYFGHGLPKDYVAAVRWYRRAAEMGNALAQSTLGEAYYHGYGMPQNYVLAAKWWQHAAAQGVGVAQLNLSVMYANGDGVAKDFVKAHMYANLAAARLPPGKDRDIAVGNREQIAREMTIEQIAESQRLATKWRPELFRPDDSAAPSVHRVEGSTPDSAGNAPQGQANGTASESRKAVCKW